MKTEFMLFGQPAQLKNCSSNCINVNSVAVDLSVNIKYMGVYLDNNLNFKKHLTHKCKIAMQNVHRICNIQSTVTMDAHTLVPGLVMPHLNFCNMGLFGLPQKSVHKIRRVQNIAAKLVLNKQKSDRVTESRKFLHWLPIAARMKFKILVLVYKCFRGDAPEYIQNLLTKKPELEEGLRSSKHSNFLLVPKTNQNTFASRSFSVIGPSLWNELSNNIKSCTNLKLFRKNVKTYLFNKYYK